MRPFLLALTLCFFGTSLFAQFHFAQKDEAAAESPYGPQLGPCQTQTWRAGIIIEPGSQMNDVVVSIPLPMDWPEQKVLKLNEEQVDAALSGKIDYRIVNDGAREMILRLGKMRPHRSVSIIVAVDLLNHELLPPENPEKTYVIPKRIPKELQQYVKESPKIECNKTEFRKMFNEITANKVSDWEKVEAVYSFVQNNVKYNDAGKARETNGAYALITKPKGSWEGDCKDMCCLFIALCRAGKIPARLVRVPEHCYAEFYLEVKDGLPMPEQTQPAPRGARRQAPPKGFWFPCQVSGTYAFGGIPERQPILQKGDSFPDPDHRPRGRKLFLSECFEGALEPGSPRPKFEWVKQLK